MPITNKSIGAYKLLTNQITPERLDDLIKTKRVEKFLFLLFFQLVNTDYININLIFSLSLV